MFFSDRQFFILMLARSRAGSCSSLRIACPIDTVQPSRRQTDSVPFVTSPEKSESAETIFVNGSDQHG